MRLATPNLCPASHAHTARWWLTTLVIVGLCGCGSEEKTYPAGGTVMLTSGKPLVGGLVQFRSIESDAHHNARGTVSEDGSFELGTFQKGDGAVPGKHQVLVLPPPFRGDLDEVGFPPRIIDPKFSSFETSGLEFTVTTDGKQNRYDIRVDP